MRACPGTLKIYDLVTSTKPFLGIVTVPLSKSPATAEWAIHVTTKSTSSPFVNLKVIGYFTVGLACTFVGNVTIVLTVGLIKVLVLVVPELVGEVPGGFDPKVVVSPLVGMQLLNPMTTVASNIKEMRRHQARTEVTIIILPAFVTS